MTPLQTLDKTNQDKADFNKAISLYGGNISSVNTDPNKTPNNNLVNVWPVVTTTSARAEVQNNSDFINNRVSGGKTVTSTVTNNGKTTTTYSDGTTDTTDNTWNSQVTTQKDVLNEQNVLLSESDKLDKEIRDRYAALQRSGDDAYNQLVKNTQDMFASTRAKLNDSNKRFESKTSQGQYLNNWFRYTPQASEGMVYDAEQYWIARLADLDNQESQALQMALSAKNDKDYAALQKYTDSVRSIQQDKVNILDRMTSQIKTIEDTDKNIRNMNTNEAKVMQSMIDSYILTAGNMDAAWKDEFYKKKWEELSKLMWFTVAPEFIRAQVEWANASAKLEVNKDLTTVNGFYTDSLGRPLTDSAGKKVPFAKEDWGEWIEWNMLNVGTYDENGNKVIKTYELTGGTKSYAETLSDLPPTKTNINITALSQAYSWPMSELLFTPDWSFVKTTNPKYKNIGNWGMQCAEFVNRIVGTSFESGKAAAKDAPNTLRVGSVASWAPAWSGAYEHAGIIIGEEGNNWIIKSANLRWNGIVSVDTVPKSVIKWGYTPDSVKSLPNEVSGVYDPLKDTQLTPTWSSQDWGLFYDSRTDKTITGKEAEALYGKAGTSWFTDDDYFNTLFNALPGGSKDNAGEVARIKEQAQKYKKEGLSPQQALLRFKWFKLADPSKADMAVEYITIGDNLLEKKPASYETTVAKYLNDENIEGLNTYVNGIVDDKVKARYEKDAILSGDYTTGEQRTNKIIDIIGRNKDKIGAFDGRVTDLLAKLRSDPEYQQLKTILQMSQADMRKYFAGSAVTETEMKALQDFIGGSTKMNPDNLITMLSTLLEDRKNVYRNQRGGMLVWETQTVTPQASTETEYVDFSSI